MKRRRWQLVRNVQREWSNLKRYGTLAFRSSVLLSWSSFQFCFALFFFFLIFIKFIFKIELDFGKCFHLHYKCFDRYNFGIERNGEKKENNPNPKHRQQFGVLWCSVVQYHFKFITLKMRQHSCRHRQQQWQREWKFENHCRRRIWWRNELIHLQAVGFCFVCRLTGRQSVCDCDFLVPFNSSVSYIFLFFVFFFNRSRRHGIRFYLIGILDHIRFVRWLMAAFTKLFHDIFHQQISMLNYLWMPIIRRVFLFFFKYEFPLAEERQYPSNNS